MSKIRVGSVRYLNAWPLSSQLDPERFEVVFDHPRRIAELLATGEVDVALAPVAAVLTDGDYRIAPGWCIGAEGAVDSVFLVAETAPEQWTEVLLDETSRTSLTLARLLLTEGPLASRVAPGLTMRQVAPGTGPAQAGGTVASLVIGDEALALDDRFTVRLDLAELWTAWTGKPFVFAVWAGRKDLPRHILDELRAAGERGHAKVPLHFAGDERDYLTKSIRYALDEPALIGLRWYASMAYRQGLVGTEHVRFYEPDAVCKPVGAQVDALLGKAADGERLTEAEGMVLWQDAPTAELATAARLRVADITRASYAVGAPVDLANVTEGLAAAAEAGCTVVRLTGTGSDAALIAAVQAASAMGMQVTGLDLVRVKAILGQLGAAGLASVTWSVAPDTAWLCAEAVEAGLAVDAVSTFTGPVDDGGWLAHLQLVRMAAPRSYRIDTWLPEGALVEPGSLTTLDWLRMNAFARLFLPSVDHLVASPAVVGIEASQTALFYGVDDLGLLGVPMQAPAEGLATFEPTLSAGERAIHILGMEPVRRDDRFEALGGPLSTFRRVRPVAERATL